MISGSTLFALLVFLSGVIVGILSTCIVGILMVGAHFGRAMEDAMDKGPMP